MTDNDWLPPDDEGGWTWPEAFLLVAVAVTAFCAAVCAK